MQGTMMWQAIFVFIVCLHESYGFTVAEHKTLSTMTLTGTVDGVNSTALKDGVSEDMKNELCENTRALVEAVIGELKKQVQCTVSKTEDEVLQTTLKIADEMIKTASVSRSQLNEKIESLGTVEGMHYDSVTGFKMSSSSNSHVESTSGEKGSGNYAFMSRSSSSHFGGVEGSPKSIHDIDSVFDVPDFGGFDLEDF